MVVHNKLLGDFHCDKMVADLNLKVSEEVRLLSDERGLKSIGVAYRSF